MQREQSRFDDSEECDLMEDDHVGTPDMARSTRLLGLSPVKTKTSQSSKKAIGVALSVISLFLCHSKTAYSQDAIDAIRKEEAYRSGIHLGRLDWAKSSCERYGIVRQNFIPTPKPQYLANLKAGQQKGRKEFEEFGKHGCFLISELYGFDGTAIKCAWEDRPRYHVGMYGMTAKEVATAEAESSKTAALYRAQCRK